ncbi:MULTISPECIES: phosphate ABC transporter permease subunit PstC [unclassified Granulicatella]|uniref:phosphate ABC transporter permease subunit PstC n=1 Tax=unclassified Granulicatella TaxID=2630493 RepID=UPI0010740AFE|nr:MULTISPECIES: phosphate ABC transporter permease subunit PstC [unclassified Granulicatella]MBF0780972.1 phosphate ABC transporter permease subunit PstC [Granulicatella sp. 19428wC4_WM01]TFU92744.1 phosphate ABC transporter permease subunit PstC [Granulicatella sp. WM01]
MKSKNKTEKVMQWTFFFSALMSVLAIVVICLFMFTNGLPFIFKHGIAEFLFGTDWSPTNVPASYGILPMIAGSFSVTLGAIIVGVPIGVLTSLYLVFFCPKWLYRYLKPAVSLMAAIPSIVYGFFGLQILVPFVRQFGGNGMSLLTASLLLGIMILPTIITLSETAFRAVPQTYYNGSIGLGASHERSVMKVMLPAAKSGVFSSIILGVGRAIGETMAVILVAGNQAIMPRALTKGVRTMTTNIVLEMAYAADEHRESLIATAVVLFIFILLINGIFTYMKRRSA